MKLFFSHNRDFSSLKRFFSQTLVASIDTFPSIFPAFKFFFFLLDWISIVCCFSQPPLEAVLPSKDSTCRPLTRICFYCTSNPFPCIFLNSQFSSCYTSPSLPGVFKNVLNSFSLTLISWVNLFVRDVLRFRASYPRNMLRVCCTYRRTGFEFTAVWHSCEVHRVTTSTS